MTVPKCRRTILRRTTVVSCMLLVVEWGAKIGKVPHKEKQGFSTPSIQARQSKRKSEKKSGQTLKSARPEKNALLLMRNNLRPLPNARAAFGFRRLAACSVCFHGTKPKLFQEQTHLWRAALYVCFPFDNRRGFFDRRRRVRVEICRQFRFVRRKRAALTLKINLPQRLDAAGFVLPEISRQRSFGYAVDFLDLFARQTLTAQI